MLAVPERGTAGSIEYECEVGRRSDPDLSGGPEWEPGEPALANHRLQADLHHPDHPDQSELANVAATDVEMHGVARVWTRSPSDRRGMPHEAAKEVRPPASRPA